MVNGVAVLRLASETYFSAGCELSVRSGYLGRSRTDCRGFGREIWSETLCTSPATRGENVNMKPSRPFNISRHEKVAVGGGNLFTILPRLCSIPSRASMRGLLTFVKDLVANYQTMDHRGTHTTQGKL